MNPLHWNCLRWRTAIQSDVVEDLSMDTRNILFSLSSSLVKRNLTKVYIGKGSSICTVSMNELMTENNILNDKFK